MIWKSEIFSGYNVVPWVDGRKNKLVETRRQLLEAPHLFSLSPIPSNSLISPRVDQMSFLFVPSQFFSAIIFPRRPNQLGAFLSPPPPRRRALYGDSRRKISSGSIRFFYCLYPRNPTAYVNIERVTPFGPRATSFPLSEPGRGGRGGGGTWRTLCISSGTARQKLIRITWRFSLLLRPIRETLTS